MLWWNSQKNQKNLFILSHLNQSLPHQSFRRSGIRQLRVDLMHCGRCYEDSMTESLWCDHNKETRADVLTSPEFNLSRGGEEDTRRKYSHIATFRPSRENWALPRVSWTKPQLRRFLHSPLPGASIAVPSSYVSPPCTPAPWLATVTSSIDLHASAFVEHKGRTQTTKDNNVFFFFTFVIFLRTTDSQDIMCF